MLSRNGYPNNFFDRCIQQFLNRKYGVTQQRDAPVEPSPSPKYISLQLPYLGSVSNNIRQELSSKMVLSRFDRFRLIGPRATPTKQHKFTLSSKLLVHSAGMGPSVLKVFWETIMILNFFNGLSKYSIDSPYYHHQNTRNPCFRVTWAPRRI